MKTIKIILTITTLVNCSGITAMQQEHKRPAEQSAELEYPTKQQKIIETITLVLDDQHKYEVPKNIALQSRTIKNLIDGDEIIYHNYQDIGIAVSTDRGLMVPIIRNAENLDLAGIEQSIEHFSAAARDGSIGLADLHGGTFSITNGGVFGSLVSTPLLNPPQSAILGMHAINERPVVIAGEIVVRPMMYLALSYDHRIIDGKEAVQFLVTVKESLEDPARFLLGL